MIRIFLICIIGFTLVIPNLVSAQQGSIASVYGEALHNQVAQTGGLVTCNGLDCDFCKLAEMTNNIINWLFGFLIVLAVMVFAYAGFRLVTSGGNEDDRKWAKDRFTYVVIGLLLMLASWLIVDTILKGLTGQGMNFWGKFDVTECGSMADPQDGDYDEFHSDFSEVSSESGFTAMDTQPSSVTQTDLVTYAGKQFDRGVAQRVRELSEKFNLRVTSGYRSPQHNARVGGSPNSWHLTGRAADFTGSEEAMQAAAKYARQQGAREVLIHNAGSGRHLHVAW